MECIGQIQKRIGSRLRKLKNTMKGVKLADGKGFSGKRRLTDGKIDILQNYYSLSVRGNIHDVREMAKSIKASTDTNPWHHFCPDGEDSWCGYKREKDNYKRRIGIP